MGSEMLVWILHLTTLSFMRPELYSTWQKRWLQLSLVVPSKLVCHRVNDFLLSQPALMSTTLSSVPRQFAMQHLSLGWAIEVGVKCFQIPPYHSHFDELRFGITSAVHHCYCLFQCVSLLNSFLPVAYQSKWLWCVAIHHITAIFDELGCRRYWAPSKHACFIAHKVVVICHVCSYHSQLWWAVQPRIFQQEQLLEVAFRWLFCCTHQGGCYVWHFTSYHSQLWWAQRDSLHHFTDKLVELDLIILFIYFSTNSSISCAAYGEDGSTDWQ